MLTKERPSPPKKKRKPVKGTRASARKKEAPASSRRPRTSGADVKEFCQRFGLTRVEYSRLTGYSLRSVDKWAAGMVFRSSARKRHNELARLLGALAEIMERKYIGEWIRTPNNAFDDSTPLQVVERGENDLIWRMVYDIQTGALA